MKKRLNQKEWMDLGPPYYTPDEYEDCLYQLDRIGRYLGGDFATLRALNSLERPPESILDVGCGGGFFTMRLARKYPKANVLGIDLSKEAISFANKRKENFPLPNVGFLVSSLKDLKCLPGSFDVISSTLVCHHLKDEELILFLKDAYQIAGQHIIMNDLHRHFLAILGYKLITPLLFRNRMVRHDGLISIKRGFLKNDWKNYLSAAEIPWKCCSIQWHMAFRWIVSIRK